MIRTSGFTPVASAPVTEPQKERMASAKPPETQPTLRTVKQVSVKRTRSARMLYTLLAVFLVGMLYGAVFLQTEDGGLWSKMSAINQSYLYAAESQSMFANFLNSLTSSCVFLALSFLGGLCAVGQPVSVLTLFIRGLGIGSYMGYFYLAHSVQGVAYSLLLIVPGVLVSVLALGLSCRESLRMSNRILCSFLRGEALLNREIFTLYLKKHLILFIFLVASAGLDCILRAVFSGIFHLG